MFYYLDIRDTEGLICLQSKDCATKEELIQQAHNLRLQAAKTLCLGTLIVKFMICDEQLNQRGVTKHINLIEDNL